MNATKFMYYLNDDFKRRRGEMSVWVQVDKDANEWTLLHRTDKVINPAGWDYSMAWDFFQSVSNSDLLNMPVVMEWRESPSKAMVDETPLSETRLHFANDADLAALREWKTRLERDAHRIGLKKV